MKENIRLGKVSAVNYAAGTVRVVYHDRDDSVTQEIPLLSSEYNMPEVGDAVLVLHLSNGAEMGVVLGCPWSDGNRPAESGKGLFRKELARKPGVAFVRCQNGVVKIKASCIVIEGNVSVSGAVTASGGVSGKGVTLDTHTHKESAGGTTAPPTAGGAST